MKKNLKKEKEEKLVIANVEYLSNKTEEQRREIFKKMLKEDEKHYKKRKK